MDYAWILLGLFLLIGLLTRIGSDTSFTLHPEEVNTSMDDPWEDK